MTSRPPALSNHTPNPPHQPHLKNPHESNGRHRHTPKDKNHRAIPLPPSAPPAVPLLSRACDQCLYSESRHHHHAPARYHRSEPLLKFPCCSGRSNQPPRSFDQRLRWLLIIAVPKRKGSDTYPPHPVNYYSDPETSTLYDTSATHLIDNHTINLRSNVSEHGVCLRAAQCASSLHHELGENTRFFFDSTLTAQVPRARHLTCLLPSNLRPGTIVFGA